jgi:hypothetical protein
MAREKHADVVICYSLERDFLTRLADRIGLIDVAAKRLGLVTYAHVRDAQQWNLEGAEYRTELFKAFEAISACQVVFLDLTAEGGSCRSGINMEAGYAMALGRTIIGLWRKPDRPMKTLSLVQFEAAYESTDEIEEAAGALLRSALGRTSE